MKKILVVSLVLVSLLLLTSAAMADRGDSKRGNHADECCPEEVVTPPCPPIVICFPEAPELDFDVCIPQPPCIPEIIIEDFPPINCPEITFDIPEICPPCPPTPPTPPCPEEDECPCPDDRHGDRHHR